MPGLSARPGIALCNPLPLSQFLRLVFFSEHSTFRYRVSNLTPRACNPVRYGFPTESVLQQRRTAAGALSRPVAHLAFGSSRVWQSRILLASKSLASPSRKGVASVRNQAQDDAVAAQSSTSNSYKALAGPCSFTLEVKKSKFIAVAAPVDDEAAALSLLSQVLIYKDQL
jgi:hypothetical protein